jgi:hypothetical protein
MSTVRRTSRRRKTSDGDDEHVKKLFLGIHREAEYSPGQHLDNDALILHLVADALQRLGAYVRLGSLAEARALRHEAAIVFSMVQGPAGLDELDEWKREGVSIVNDPAASRRTYRDRLCPLLGSDGVAFPRSIFLPTAGDADLDDCRDVFERGAAWLKRADVHATCSEDVVRLDTWEQLEPALHRFGVRGLRRAVLQEHREGDEVKFYGVASGRLFWPYYPRQHRGYPFDERGLRRMAELAARELAIGIYGGDAIVGPDGSLSLIDLNDWPSFAPCRGAAAYAIARHVIAEERRSRRPVDKLSGVVSPITEA